jgi:hypothetical protein
MTDETTDDETDRTRRNVLVSVAGLGALGLGFGAGQASGQSAPDGEIGTSSNPYLRAWIDRQVFVGRTSDPSSPADGTMWYREDL